MARECPPIGMYPNSTQDIGRKITWRSVIAGFVLIAGIFVISVAASYPYLTTLILAVGIGIHVLFRVAPTPRHESRPTVPLTKRIERIVEKMD